MARNRKNGRRGRNRGSIYARPIPEPSNFIEIQFDFSREGETNNFVLSHEELFEGILTFIPQQQISKYRVSSVVIDPLASAAASNLPCTAVLGISGHEFLFAQTNKPLRIKLGKDYGDDGMWIVTDSAAITDEALPGNEVVGDTFLALNVPDVVGDFTTTVHVRIAWSDPT